jgi:hypothetical protein
MFDFTGTEKSAAALTPLMVPMTTMIVAMLSLAGLGDMPEADVLAQAIAFTVITLLAGRLVWQVPNTPPAEVKKIEAEKAASEETPA